MKTIPTLNQLYTAIKSDFETQYGASIPVIGKSFMRVFAAVQAGKLKLFYLVIGNLQKNIFVDTADPESLGGTLERFGRVKLGRNPYPAVAAEYSIAVSGTIGSVIKTSTTFKSDDTSLNPGSLFILDNEYTMLTTLDFIVVRALKPGVESKLRINDTLTATAPIANIDSGVVVNSIITEPLAAETIEAYRAAIINSYRLEAYGGAATDYRIWAQDAQGVRYVYPYAKSGVYAEINLFVEATIADSIDGKGTPSGTLLNDVKAVIEFDPDTTLPLNERGRQPLGVFQVNYLPVTIKLVDIVITGLDGYDSTVGALITQAIRDGVNLMRPFVAAADILANKNDIIDKNKIIGMIISQRPGATFVSLDLKIDGVSLNTYTFINGNIPDLNSVTYVP